MIYILLFTMILFLVLSYRVFDRDIISPSVIVCIMFIICITFATYNIDNWGIDYQFKTYMILFLGLLSFIITGIIINYACKISLRKKINKNYNNELKLYNLDKKIMFIFLVIDIGTTFFYFKEVYRISLLAGNDLGYLGMMSYYRGYVAYNSLAEGIPTLLTEFVKLCTALGFVSIYIFIYNSIIKRDFKRDGYLIIFILLTMIQTVLGGGRGTILWLFSTAFVASYITVMRKRNWKGYINSKYIKDGILILIVLLFGFYFLKNLIRIFNTTDSIVDYISAYAGGSIQLFDLYIKDPILPSKLVGQESFVGIYNTLDKLGFMDIASFYPNNSNLEFRLSNGISIGNVYGAFRRYYHDFGIVGVCSLQMICSAFYHIYYNKIRTFNKSHKADFYILLYSYLTYHLFMMPIDDIFFKSFISVNCITTVILLYFVYYIMSNVKIKW